MKKIGELEKRLEKLEPKDPLAPYRDLLDEIQKALPKREYVPYPYPVYPQYPLINPGWPGNPWITFADTPGTNDTSSIITYYPY